VPPSSPFVIVLTAAEEAVLTARVRSGRTEHRDRVLGVACEELFQRSRDASRCLGETIAVRIVAGPADDGAERILHLGAIRPRVVLQFPGGLWQMMQDNGFSRVYLGVHWSFDAFALDEDGVPDLTKNVGGVPLGIAIANDIAAHGLRASGAVGPALS